MGSEGTGHPGILMASLEPEQERLALHMGPGGRTEEAALGGAVQSLPVP